MGSDNPPSALDVQRHVRYWQRCHRTCLPHHYTGYDSTRMTLVFFIVAALDLLSPTAESGEPPLLTTADHAKVRTWVLQLQHPDGGFCGSPNHVLPDSFCHRTDPSTLRSQPAQRSSANLAATYFALLLLALTAEGDGSGAFAEVNRTGTLRYLKKLQRPDGSFGEVLLDDGTIEGGRDMRHCHLASMIRWCLRGRVEKGEPGWVEDIDVAALVNHIRRGQAYDGGIAESSQHESHAGYAYCAIGALSLLDRHENTVSERSSKSKMLLQGVPDVESLVKFLVFRQFPYLERPPARDDDKADDEDVDNFVLPQSLKDLSLEENMQFVGFNGRCNKVADTCYFWWVGATLSMLSRESLIAAEPSRNFVLAKTQHLAGGFSKHPGDPPDIYHAYLGLAALATMGEPSLKEFDVSLCASTATAQRIERARKGLLDSARAKKERDTSVHDGNATWEGQTASWPRSGIDDKTKEKLSAALKTLET